jgi:MoaA/NifB/PqqE/SkfB family radical SAM enzyme
MPNQYSTNSLNEKELAVHSSEKTAKYINPLNKALRIFFKNAVMVCIKNPPQALYFFHTVRYQQKASGIRAGWEKQGLHVPPIMIFSVTNRCNLHCKGCYHQTLRDKAHLEMSEEKLHSVIREAKELGVSFMVLAGGEPLVRQDILKITRDFPEIIFFMFTNGLMITDEMVAQFKMQKNIVPIISLEGYDEDTDKRRGVGVYELLQETIAKIKKQSVFFGTSLTVTRSNFDTVTNPEYIHKMTKSGCQLFLFAEYTPVAAGTEDWVITQEQRDRINEIMASFRSRYSALFISVPGDEEEFGGCLSAGRGFVHISAEGDVEPCPFAPYSDCNVREKSLKEALQSDFLKAIRENDELGKETGGSCALFAKREWVQSLLANSKGNS